VLFRSPTGVSNADVRIYFWGGTSVHGNTHLTKISGNVTTNP